MISYSSILDIAFRPVILHSSANFIIAQTTPTIIQLRTNQFSVVDLQLTPQSYAIAMR